MSQFTYIVQVETERVSGLFAGKDEIEAVITEALENCESDISLTGLGAEGSSEYEVASYTVDTQDPDDYDRMVKMWDERPKRGKAKPKPEVEEKREVAINPNESLREPFKSMHRRTVRDLTAMWKGGVAPTDEQATRLLRDAYVLLTGDESVIV